MADSYSHTLKYAGSDPFEPEEERDDITHEEWELLTQDATYQKLAQVRWLASELETDLSGNADIPKETRDQLFQATATQDASLREAVEAYVDDWLARHRADAVTCESADCEETATHVYEVNAPVRGHDIEYLCSGCLDEKQQGAYCTVRELAGVDA